MIKLLFGEVFSINWNSLRRKNYNLTLVHHLDKLNFYAITESNNAAQYVHLAFVILLLPATKAQVQSKLVLSFHSFININVLTS